MNSNAWPSHSANMFSSILPGVPTNMTFMHNPPSKSSNRYVKSSTNPNVSYLSNPSLYDLGYLPILTREGPPATWYPNSAYNPPYGQDYAIYSTSASNTFNYDQSTQFLDFEDAHLMISPSISTASLETQKSPVDAESLIDGLDIPGSENRVIQASFTFPTPSSQGATVGRTLSTYPISGDHMIAGQHYSANINIRSSTPFQPVIGDIHQMPRALHPSYPSDLNEDCRSTISELEVEERDRIAKINAEYNAISHSGSLNNSPPPPKYSPDRFRESNPTYQLSSMQTRPYLSLSVSQPRHPDLHFPQRQIGSEKKEPSPPPYRIYASPVVSVPQDLSPPSVERLPSQLTLEQNVITNKTSQSQSSPPASSRNHEGTSDLDRPRIVQNGVSSPTSFIHSSPQTGHPGNVGQSFLSGVERGQTLEPSSIVPAEITRKSRSPVVSANGHSSEPLAGDVQDGMQNKQQPQPDAPILIAKNHTPPYNNTSPDSRHYTGVITSSPQFNEASELESTERISLGENLRRDTKTPGTSGRGPSNTQPSLESSSASSQDVHSSPDMRHKSSSKGFLDEKAGYPDKGRSHADSLSSSDSSCSSVSPSNRPLPHEDVLRLKSKDADYDRDFERHIRQRSNGTERTPVPKFIDETSRGTAPMHTQGPLHLSPEIALATFLPPDPQVVSIVTASEHRPTDLRHSKTVYDHASIPNSPDSRESRKVHERQYLHFAKPHPKTAKYEGNEMRILSTALQSSPVSKSAMTSSSLPSKFSLDFPPTTAPPEPHRRRSDGDQVGPPTRPPLSGRNSAPMVRSVRWTENLVAPSPILAPPRRKGWFNRRGDQLWTNNGDYRPPRSGDEYSLDLNDYPEPGDGWMNEDGIRIDMSHCRIPKALPRPALKKP